MNERAEKAELEITAVSIHQYPYICKDYALTSCGSSMGDGYGPMLISPTDFKLEDVKGKRIAIPGLQTTAWLAFQLALKEVGLSKDDVTFEVVMFDEIIDKVLAGEFDAGLIIHEGQLTYGESGLHAIIDLGEWWTSSRKLPLPLGGNAIRRDLGEKQMGVVCRILLESIEYALENREASVEYAMNYARDMGTELADKFVGMYVNKWTLDYGDEGRRAVQQLMDEGIAAGLIPDVGEVDFIRPSGK